MTKEIQLTNGKKAVVDDEDYEVLNKHTWHYSGGYAVRLIKKSGGKSILMHREIMNTPDGMETDHIDHNGLNNCKNNLRICNQHQNQANSKLRIDNTSGFKGVNFKKSQKSWQANIKCNGKKIFIGSFLTPGEASFAYEKTALELFGEFANINHK
jgi:hypothetical protein